MGLGFYVTNSDRRVRVGDRVIFTNHIQLLNEGLRNWNPSFHISNFNIFIGECAQNATFL